MTVETSDKRSDDLEIDEDDLCKDEFVKTIPERLIESKNCTPMAEVYDLYSQILRDKGRVDSLSFVRNRWIKRLIEKEFENKVQLHTMKSGKGLMIPLTLSNSELAESLHNAQQEVKSLEHLRGA